MTDASNLPIRLAAFRAMLRHGLQGMQGQLIDLPAMALHRPDRDLLAQRLERFEAR